MRNTVLYIAMSLDGYIADEKGGVDWLTGDGSAPEHPGSYGAFIKTVDTIILGYKTYHQIVTELSPDAWVYKGKKSYVITHKAAIASEEIIFTDRNLEEFITELKNNDGKDIWICGGASIVNQMLDFDLIDRFCITVIPTLLGRGVRLFTGHKKQTQLKLLSAQSYNGMTDLVYERKAAATPREESNNTNPS